MQSIQATWALGRKILGAFLHNVSVVLITLLISWGYDGPFKVSWPRRWQDGLELFSEYPEFWVVACLAWAVLTLYILLVPSSR